MSANGKETSTKIRWNELPVHGRGVGEHIYVLTCQCRGTFRFVVRVSRRHSDLPLTPLAIAIR